MMYIKGEKTMLNQCALVGRIKEKPVLKTTANGIKNANLILEVERSFRNQHGEYENDLFSVALWRGIAEECIETCQVGALISIKGRLQAYTNTYSNDQTYYNTEIVAEKVSFLHP